VTIFLYAAVWWIWSVATWPQTQTLDDVVNHAVIYASEYEHQLTAIIAEEDYQQVSTVTRYRPDGHTYIDTRKRSLHSDFLITNPHGDRVAIRYVREVDGMPVDSIFSLSEGSPDDIEKLKAESVRYNIGIPRNFSIPLFAMEVLRESNRTRFLFQSAGEADVDGIRVWKVGFKETTGPALLHDSSSAKDLLSSGTLWIEPETGRVLQTEIHSEGVRAGGVLTTSTAVKYGSNQALGFWVPVRMDERYSQTGSTLECHAEYQNYRRFQVDVKLNTEIPDAPSPSAHLRPGSSSLEMKEEAVSSAPLDVLLLFDRSALQQNTTSTMRRAARAFLQNFDAGNRVAVARFDSSIEMIGWWTDSRAQIIAALNQAPDPAVVQTSSLYAAISRGLRSELLPIQGRRRVLVVLTAGRDDELFTSAWRSGRLPEKPSAELQVVLDQAANAGIPILIVGFNTDQNYQSTRNPDEVVNVLGRYFPGSPLKTDFLKLARMNLESLTKASGGKIYFPHKLGDIAPLYSEIAHSLSDTWNK
jgi:hypothetical protein